MPNAMHNATNVIRAFHFTLERFIQQTSVICRKITKLPKAGPKKLTPNMNPQTALNTKRIRLRFFPESWVLLNSKPNANMASVAMAADLPSVGVTIYKFDDTFMSIVGLAQIIP